MSLAEERKRRSKLWQERLKTFAAKEAEFKHFPLIKDYVPRLIDPAPLWRVFHRQKEAFCFARQHPHDVHVFAFEKENTAAHQSGLRSYFVTHYKQLWHVVNSFAELDKFKTFYEVIPEGATCKLYFDLEFSKELNPEHNGMEMVKTFVKYVCHHIHDVYSITCSERHVIDLDASTETKFSRHLIFNLPGAVFIDNIHAGNFVHHICDENMKTILSSDEVPSKKPKLDEEFAADILQQLLIKNKNGDQMLFVDKGVYTRNRNFRLYKCSKLGKDNPLELASSNKYKPKLDKKSPKTKEQEEYNLFLDSIITNVRFTTDLRILSFEEGPNKSRSSTSKNTGDQSYCDRATTSDKSNDLLEGFQHEHSPYPDIDKFIRTCVKQGGIQGEIRRWLYFTQGQMLIYDISKNRWCGNIKRQHKSNNIMITVDLKLGVYYQKCHDPDCRAQNYKSQEQPLPPNILPVFFDEFDDEELLAATEKAEQMKAVECVEEQGGSKNGGVKCGGGVKRTLGGGDGSSNTGLQDGYDVTDEEMLAAASELDDSGIENS